jgi:hypothetical protein
MITALNWLYSLWNWLLFNSTLKSKSKSHYDRQSGPSWCQASIWDPRPIFLSPWDFLLDSYCLLCCSALSDERTGLRFTVAAGPFQRSHLTRGQVCLLAVFRQYHSIMSHYLHKIFTRTLSVFDRVQECSLCYCPSCNVRADPKEIAVSFHSCDLSGIVG